MKEETRDIELTEQEEIESLAQLIETLQRAVNKAGRRRGLTGHEWHPLNVIDMGLFNLLCTARLAAGTFGKNAEDSREVPTGND